MTVSPEDLEDRVLSTLEEMQPRTLDASQIRQGSCEIYVMPLHYAWSTRTRSRSSFARPYICLSNSFTR